MSVEMLNLLSNKTDAKMFWKKNKYHNDDSRSDDRTMHRALDKAWKDASEGLGLYIGFREKYNLPPSLEMWKDDFTLGFRDGIGHLHFQTLHPEIPKYSETLWDWKDKSIQLFSGDCALNDVWLNIIHEEGGYTERGEYGAQSAAILESWRLQKEMAPGAMDYLRQHEKDYRDRHSDATRFNIEYALLMEHFVLPLIMSDKEIHPSIEAFS